MQPVLPSAEPQPSIAKKAVLATAEKPIVPITLRSFNPIPPLTGVLADLQFVYTFVMHCSLLTIPVQITGGGQRARSREARTGHPRAVQSFLSRSIVSEMCQVLQDRGQKSSAGNCSGAEAAGCASPTEAVLGEAQDHYDTRQRQDLLQETTLPLEEALIDRRVLAQ